MSAHTVYRCYDADGRLLYVGCSSRFKTRIAQHQHAGPGAPLASRVLAVCMARVEVASTHASRTDALEAEWSEIQSSSPLLNIQGGQPTWMTLAGIADYLTARGVEIESVGLSRCLYCDHLRPYRATGYICQDCHDADFRAWIDQRQMAGAA